MNRRKLHSSQASTGQIPEVSLNTIYNRVTLLKSKNYPKPHPQAASINWNDAKTHHSHQQSFTLPIKNNHPNHTHRTLKEESRVKQSRMSSIHVNNGQQEGLPDREDNLKTNFWPSQPLVRERKLSGQSSRNAGNEEKPQFSGKNNNSNRVSSKRASNLSKLQRDYSQGQRNATLEQNGQRRNTKVALTANFQTASKNIGGRPYALPPRQANTSSKKYRPFSGVNNKPTRLSFSRQHNRPSMNSFYNQQPTIRLNQVPYNSSNNRKLRPSSKSSKKSLLSSSKVSLLKGEDHLKVYRRQLSQFQTLYEKLSKVLEATRLGIEEVEQGIKEYAQYIQSRRFSFIDDFLEEKQSKLQKHIRITQLHETLSICYLFLEIVQQREQDNESYLVNFIGYSLSNLLLVARLYIIKEKPHQYCHQNSTVTAEQSQQYKNSMMESFEADIRNSEESSYGQELTSEQDILLRIQHNNEIITMIHKRLGRNNIKFETCIKKFLKQAEGTNNRFSCSMIVHYIFEYLAMHIHEIDMVGVSDTLQLAPQPYTPPATHKYTLVIEPVGILEKNSKMRPYVNEFMKWATKWFDIVLWTWEMAYNVEDIYGDNSNDSYGIGKYAVAKLYRHHCTVKNNIFMKDLSRLNRDLDRTVVVDFDRRIWGPEYDGNGIELRWRGSVQDKNLLILSQILEQMVISNTTIKDTKTFYGEQIQSIKGY